MSSIIKEDTDDVPSSVQTNQIEDGVEDNQPKDTDDDASMDSAQTVTMDPARSFVLNSNEDKTRNKSLDNIFACHCGPKFQREAMLTRHCMLSARKEMDNREYVKALEHVNKRMEYSYSTRRIQNTVTRLKKQLDDILADIETSNRISQREITVHTDGSGDVDNDGVFRCGIGVNILGGQQLSFPLAGDVQTVMRANLQPF